MMHARSMLALASIASIAASIGKPKAAVVHATVPQGSWISLFNGHDLQGWTPKIAGLPVNENYRNTFRVQDGLLKVSYADYDQFGDRFGSLFYNTKFGRYWLRAEYRFSGDLAPGAPRWAFKNSGIQLHSQSPQSMSRTQRFPVSVEFDLVGGRFMGSQPTGDVCHYGTWVLIDGLPTNGQCSKAGEITIRDDRWVSVLAEVDGATRVRHFVNGELVVQYTNIALDESNEDARRLLAAGAAKSLSGGYISIQSNGHPVEFRRIEILPLAPGGP
jgi:hypothetical protein